MELKRYVLLKRGTILTKRMFEEQKKVDDWFATRLFIKTSDNILDLVEVGDLADIRDGIMSIDGIYENDIVLCRDIVTKDKDNIKAIYKRQSNGDYKRYEVEA